VVIADAIACHRCEVPGGARLANQVVGRLARTIINIMVLAETQGEFMVI
jgi:hypothetical protein